VWFILKKYSQIKPTNTNYGLPICNTAAEIAAAINISVGQLRFLAFARKTSTISHYIRFKIPKKTGGHRLISAPMPRLKKVQHWILSNILEKMALHTAAHGFRSQHSIVTNQFKVLLTLWQWLTPKKVQNFNNR
jgi:RNA-directed DNA polymerase